MGNKKGKALGRGLSALLENESLSYENSYERAAKKSGQVGTIAEIKINQIVANPFQPRTHFEEQALKELSESIKVHGVIQPVAVRKVEDQSYQLISGERRFRASQLAGIDEIPAYVREADDQTMLEMALVENIQRENLDAIEVAISYQRLIDECNLTQEKLAEKVAKSRAAVTNYLRLLKLPVEVQYGIRDKKISMGHARALISIPKAEQQIELYNKTIDQGLSVRQVEQLAKALKEGKTNTSKKESLKKAALSFEQQKHLIDLHRILETKIDIKKDGDGKGKIAIPFNNDDDLTRILDLLNP